LQISAGTVEREGIGSQQKIPWVGSNFNVFERRIEINPG
jgi:hypothetical protein